MNIHRFPRLSAGAILLIGLSGVFFYFLIPLLLWTQDKTVELVEETRTKWSYAQYTNDILYWQAKGEKAYIKGNQKEFRVETITLTYYLDIQEGVSTPTNKFIVLEADEGVIKEADNSAVFTKNVRMTMPTASAPDLQDYWKLRGTVLEVRGIMDKNKAQNTILISSKEPVTLTETAGITITAASLSGTIQENISATGKTHAKTSGNQQIKATFKKAEMVRAPAQGEEGKVLFIRSDIMDLYQDHSGEEIISLKGNKNLLITNMPDPPAGIPAAAISHTPWTPLRITSMGNALIYPRFYEITFRDEAKAEQIITQTAGDKVITSTDTMTADTLGITLDQSKNDIQRAVAEGNVQINNREGKFISGENLDWQPVNHLLTIKSKNEVKFWDATSSVRAKGMIIHTADDSAEAFGSWKTIEYNHVTIATTPEKK